ncbi:MAG: acyltransferase [Bacteroidales bacterium]|nr:acyltransferase [Bacteroidales bacterium]
MENLLLILLLFLLVFKWLAFLILSPLVIFYKKREGTGLQNASVKANPAGAESPAKAVKTLGTFKKRLAALAQGYCRYMDIETGKIPSHHIRNFLYRHIFHLSLYKEAVLYYGAEIRCHRKCVIGKGCIIGDRAVLDARNSLTIGKNVTLSTGVSIYTEQHDYRNPNFDVISRTGSRKCSVEIDDYAWIGPNVIILPGVHIGEGAVVGGGAVVTHDVNPYAVVAGIPARPIGERPRGLKYDRSGSHLPFL